MDMKDTQRFEMDRTIKPKNGSKIKIFNILFVINFLIVLVLVYLIVSRKLFIQKQRIIIVSAELLIQLILGIIIIRKKGIKFIKFLAILAMINIMIINSLFIIYTKQVLDVFNSISKRNVSNAQFSLVVRTDSKYNNIEDVKNEVLYYPSNISQKTFNLVNETLKNEYGATFETNNSKDLIGVAKSLLEGNSEVILLNESYREFITDQYRDFNNLTKVIKSFDIVVKETVGAKSKDVNYNDSFNIYISGIDTFGDISTVSRSDVNLILSVNPNTNKIVITTIPRDTYTRIAGDGENEYDKLTHAGLYGVESSIKTIENLLGITINYYARVNFSSLIKMVDVLGGIEVENVETFTSRNGYHYPKGTIHLTGEEALEYSRERYNLNEGEVGRGKNQERVVTGMLRKAMSPSIIFNYSGFLGVILESMETNMGQNKLIELINKQISDGKGWDIKSIDVKGEGTSAPSFAMGGQSLYMMIPFDESIEETRAEIIKLLEEK